MSVTLNNCNISHHQIAGFRSLKTILVILLVLSHLLVFQFSSKVFGTTLSETYFINGFESGDFSAWDGVKGTGGENQSVVTTDPHHGAYHAAFTSDGSGGWEASRCWKATFKVTTLYMRVYVKVTQNGIQDVGDRFFFIIYAGNAIVGWAGWWKDLDGQIKWALCLYNNGKYPYVLGSIVNINQWYCVELAAYMHATNGWAKLYINGNLECQLTNKNTSGGLNWCRVFVGLAELTNCGPTTVYVDCVVISSTYIGLELGWLNGYQFRKSHIINPASGAGRNYQVRFRVHYGGGTDNGEDVYLNGRCRQDFGDIRFTAFDGITPLSYWMENCRVTENPTTSSGFFRIKSDGSVYAGQGDTLYKSADGGQTWLALYKVPNAAIDVVFVASNGYVYFMATGANVAKSDRGLWRGINDETFSRVQELPAGCTIFATGGFDEDGEGKLFFGVYTFGSVSNAKIYKSKDNGSTWEVAYYDPTARHIHNVQVDKSNGYVYATVGDASPPWNTEYIIRSTDNGKSWSKILADLPQTLAICVTPNARLFGTDAAVNGMIFRTAEDFSCSMVLDVGQNAYCWWIRRDPLTGKIYASFVSTESNPTFARIYVSEDDGQTWATYRTLTAFQAYDGSFMASNFVDGAMYYSTVEGGIWKANLKLQHTDYAIFWVKVSDDLSENPTTIYIYYGNPIATATSNLTGTFIRVIDGVRLALSMDENINDVACDRSGYSNHGFISGAFSADGKFGKALSFDGDDYVRVADAKSLDVDEITIAVWTKITGSMGSLDSVCGKGWTDRIYLSGNRIRCLLIDANGNQASLLDTENMQLNTWYHIAVTYSVAQDIVKLYVNGVLKASSSGLNTVLQANNHHLYIGMRACDSYPYKGVIDEFQLYNRALTDEEIIILYDNYCYSTPEYAGSMLIRKYICPEPSHGAWGREEVAN
jgi:photosystem II stability/assembly factor-like uncharacterized protein